MQRLVEVPEEVLLLAGQVLESHGRLIEGAQTGDAPTHLNREQLAAYWRQMTGAAAALAPFLPPKPLAP